MKINVDVKWSEEELGEILTRELAKHNLKPKEGGFTWEMLEDGEGGVKVEVSVHAEQVEMKETPPSKRRQEVNLSSVADQPIDMATLRHLVPKEAIGPLTKAFEEAEKAAKREKLPGETIERP